MSNNILVVFIGGGVGASFRYLLYVFFQYFSLRPWSSTFCANLIGSIVLFALVKWLKISSESMNLFVKVGILGGLTTFSSFCFDVVSLYQTGKFVESLLVFLLNIVFGIGVGILIL